MNYSDKADANDTGDTIIEEYKVSSTSPDEADPASARLVLKVEQPTNSSTLSGITRVERSTSVPMGSLHRPRGRRRFG